MRWPQNAVRLVGRAGALSPGKTYKLMRALRKHALNYLGQLWMLASDRRHAKNVTAQMAELKAPVELKILDNELIPDKQPTPPDGT